MAREEVAKVSESLRVIQCNLIVKLHYRKCCLFFPKHVAQAKIHREISAEGLCIKVLLYYLLIWYCTIILNITK